MDKIVIIMGATGTGKSRLSIDIATRFDGEIINSDKIQFHRGLNVATNKVTEQESRGVPHHLLGFINPNEDDFTARDFVERATSAADQITRRGRLPIIVGGSNSLVEALAIDDVAFGSKYECCFLWVDVSGPVLHASVSRRVDRMVDSGLVEECREFFDPTGGDYSCGIRRAIGVPELHEYFDSGPLAGSSVRERLLEEAVERIKGNTRELARRQLRKILRLGEIFGRRMHRLDATEVFVANGGGGGVREEEAWERLVVGPGARIVGRFLFENNYNCKSSSKERVADYAATAAATSAPRAIVALVGPP